MKVIGRGRMGTTRHPADVDAYYAIKDPEYDVIMGGAPGWGATTGWVPEPSDQ